MFYALEQCWLNVQKSTRKNLAISSYFDTVRQPDGKMGPKNPPRDQIIPSVCLP